MNKLSTILNFIGRKLPPVGTVAMFAGTADTIPIGWLFCRGQAVSRTTYAKLFAVIGTTYGNGDGSTTFNVPDLRGRVPLGVGNGTALNHTNHELADLGGRENAIIPYHKHSIAAQTIESSGGHTHELKVHSNAGSGSAYVLEVTSTAVKWGSPTVSGQGKHTHTVKAHDTAYMGTSGNTVGANMMPYITLNYIIKVN